MSFVMGFSVYSLRISSDLHVQSENIPKITVFFLSSVGINLFGVFWFIQLNYFKSNEYFPKLYKTFVEFIQKFICLLFHRNESSAGRETQKVAPKDDANNNELPLKASETLKEFKSENKCKFYSSSKENSNLTEKLILEPNNKLINLFHFVLVSVGHLIMNLVFFFY